MIEDVLAAWVAGLRWDALPPRARTRVEDVFLDALASGLASQDDRLLQRVTPVARSFAGAGSPAEATFVYAYAITSATVCDVYRPGLCHVSPVVLPPLAAIADERESSLEDVLVAFAAGLEVTVRLSLALDYPTLRRHGWHSPGVVGPVGAAAAAARLLGLGALGTANALAHGAAQAAGTFASLGTEAVKFNQARGALAGLLAALMAEAGLNASDRWLTHPDGGMAHSYAGGGSADALTAELGDRWELERISLRRWPAASSVQSLIEVCLELDVTVGDVESVQVELGRDAYLVSGERPWSDPLSAKQSARWVAAAVLHDRDWWLDQTSPERIRDAELAAFAAERVRVGVADELEQAGVRVQVGLRDGRELTGARATALGDPERPLTRAQIEEKLRRAAGSAGLGDLADEVLEFLSTTAPHDSVAPLFRLVHPARAVR